MQHHQPTIVSEMTVEDMRQWPSTICVFLDWLLDLVMPSRLYRQRVSSTCRWLKMETRVDEITRLVADFEAFQGRFRRAASISRTD